MKIKTPSKINIFLKITGKRSDGYHEIETLFIPLNAPCDTITAVENNKAIPLITSTSDDIPLDNQNICYKAVIQFAESAEISQGWDIHIEKNIPVSAGLGGGSSDAAALLRILNAHHHLSDKTVFNIAVELGADVPFFLNPKPATAEGIGEKLLFVEDIPSIPTLIVNPRFPISAAWAYRNYIPEDTSSSTEDVIDALRALDYIKLEDVFRNDLQPAAFKKFPILDILKHKLLDSGAAFAAMSGSGPSLFAFYESRTKAAESAEIINKEFDNSLDLFVTETLS